MTPDEIKKLCGWSLSENPEPGNPRNLDFFEADVQKVMQLLNAERTHTAPEVREALKYYARCMVCGGSGKRWEHDETCLNNENGDCVANHPRNKICDICQGKGNHCADILSLPGLEAVECYTCFLIKTGLLDHLDPCPQRCDKGRVWVRKEKL